MEDFINLNNLYNTFLVGKFVNEIEGTTRTPLLYTCTDT